MIAKARTLPGGEAQNLRWIAAPVEKAPLEPPYALITAGESLHWMDWQIVLPRFAHVVTPNGMLAILYKSRGDDPWEDELQHLITRFSSIRIWGSLT